MFRNLLRPIIYPIKLQTNTSTCATTFTPKLLNNVTRNYSINVKPNYLIKTTGNSNFNKCNVLSFGNQNNNLNQNVKSNKYFEEFEKEQKEQNKQKQDKQDEQDRQDNIVFLVYFCILAIFYF